MIERETVAAYLDSLAKPRGSLGRLERIAADLAVAQGALKPQTRPRRIVLFAADHGVVAAGVTAWPSTVTQLMIGTIAAGRAASSVLARETGTDLRLIDVGSLGEPLAPAPPTYRRALVRAGSGNLAVEPALSLADLEAAWTIGIEEADAAAMDGMRVILAGEMGIGNTTPSACLAMLLAGLPVEVAVGPGAGSDAAVVARKREVVAGAVGRARPLLQSDPRAAIAQVAGLEIVAMAGLYAGAAERGIAVLLDGFVSGAAALIAERVAPGTRARMLAGHVSAEPGHAGVLAHLELEPMLDWGMRLGEGTGALTALPLLDQAAAVLSGMATLAELGVGRKD